MREGSREVKPTQNEAENWRALSTNFSKISFAIYLAAVTLNRCKGSLNIWLLARRRYGETACRCPAGPVLFVTSESISLPGEVGASPTTAQKLR
jgi:hypothetical protein